MFANILKTMLRTTGRAIPNIKYIRAFPNLVLKPIHNHLGLGGGVVPVLGFKMLLDPKECVDSGLWFTPHIYDKKELQYILAHYQGGIFIDLGANIGFWSLSLARVFPQAKIFSIEANPKTFEILVQNVRLNGFAHITPVNCGIAATNGTMPLYLNESGNRGGDTLKAGLENRRKINVPVQTLKAFLDQHKVHRIDLLKIDVEGMEVEIFRSFFAAERDPARHPRLICAETLHSPELLSLLCENGYHVALQARENAILEKTAT